MCFCISTTFWGCYKTSYFQLNHSGKHFVVVCQTTFKVIKKWEKWNIWFTAESFWEITKITTLYKKKKSVITQSRKILKSIKDAAHFPNYWVTAGSEMTWQTARCHHLIPEQSPVIPACAASKASYIQFMHVDEFMNEIQSASAGQKTP